MIALALLSACSPRVDEVPEHMLNAQMPPGQATLKRLFAKGHLRAATQADVDAYNRAATMALPVGRPPYVDHWLEAPRAFVLLKPFEVTPDMGYLTLRQIIVPVGVELDGKPSPLFTYYFIADGHCTALGGQCPGAPKYDYKKVLRERHDREQREIEQTISEGERDSGDWGDSGKKPEPPRNPGPIERLTE
ncbi:MAG: hypothetical protein ACKOPG_09140 [Novosphingobium sp.]